jgi:endonuclease YncB( thermonuclease family)
MKKSILIIGSILFASLSVQATPFHCVKLRSCYDGDTCRFDLRGDLPPVFGDNLPVRIRGIDTPEIRGKCRAEKVKAKEARDIVREFLGKAKCIDLINPGRGKYFRIVADVVADGKSVKNILLNRGLAVEYSGGTKMKRWCKELNATEE